jgi:hypothetical protein
MSLILIMVVLVLLFGGGGFYGHRQGYIAKDIMAAVALEVFLVCW